MKKLNSKGFTLIELLSVIVILAIIIAITAPRIFNAVDNSKKSALDSSASTLKSWYNETKLADNVANENDKILTGYEATEAKQCLDEGFFKVAKQSSAQFKLGTKVSEGCSFYYKKDGAVEFVLVANENGKFYLGDAVSKNESYKYMWASSDGTNSWDNKELGFTD